MEDVNESLDFLALLDEVEEDTVSRLVKEMSPTISSSCEFGSSDALDILSICDSSSANTSMTSGSSATQAHLNEADGFAAEADDRETHVQQNVLAQTPSVERGCEKPNYFLSADYEANQHSAVINRNYELTNNFIVHTTGTGENVSARKRGRWQFSKWQKEHLDGVFKKNMYPSKWKLTELCTALQVPMHTLRNRRWRLRKSQGLTGDLHTRGSRAMLPDKDETTSMGCLLPDRDETTSMGCHQSTAIAARVDSCFSQLSSGRSQTPKVSISVPNPRTSSLFPLKTSSSSPSLAPILPSPSSSLYLMSTPHPHSLLGDLGQSMGEYRWGLPSLTASLSLPSTLNRLNGSPLLSAHPFDYSASQWLSYGCSLPALPPFYSSDMKLAQMRTSTEEVSMETNSSSLPYKSHLQKPVPTPAYLFYSKPPHHFAGQRLPAVVCPATATAMDCSVDNKSSGVFHSSAISHCSPRPATFLALPKGSEQSQTPRSPGPHSNSYVDSMSGSLMANVEAPGETGSNNALSKSNNYMSSRMQYCSHFAAPSTVQSACACELCLNHIGAPVWTSNLPCPAERILDPCYSKAIQPSLPSLPSTFLCTGFQAGSSIPGENVRTAQITMDQDDLFKGGMMPGVKDESEDVDVLTVCQSAEEEISSTSDYTK